MFVSGADRRVPDVGQMRDLRAGADLRVLHLDERADLRPLQQYRARAAGTRTGRPRPAGRRWPARRARGRRWRRRRRARRSAWCPARPPRRRRSRSRRADGCSARPPCRGPSVTPTSIHVVSGSMIVTPSRIQARLIRSRRMARSPASSTRSLQPSTSVGSPVACATTVRSESTSNEITSVRYSSPWSLSVVSLLSACASSADSKAYTPGVDLGDGPLVGRGVALLDDRVDGPGDRVADHAAEPVRVLHLGGQDRGRRADRLVRLDQRRQRARAQQWDVAVDDDDGARLAAGRLQGEPGGVPGAALLGLQYGTGVRGDLGQMGDRVGPRRARPRRSGGSDATPWSRRGRARAGCGRAADGASSAAPTSSACPRPRRGRSQSVRLSPKCSLRPR